MVRVLLIAALVELAASQAVTVNAISQIGDGQIQAPTGPNPAPPAPAPPASSAIVPQPSEPPIATDTASYSNPLTTYATGSGSVVVPSISTVPTAQSQPAPAPPASSPPAVTPSATASSSVPNTLPPSSQPVVETTVVVTSSRAPTSPAIASVTAGGADTNRITGAAIALLVVSAGFFML